MMPSREELLLKASRIPGQPVAVEAFWDGDTQGWFVVLTMIYRERRSLGFLFSRGRLREYDLASMRGTDGDLRIFNGHVPLGPRPLWPLKSVMN